MIEYIKNLFTQKYPTGVRPDTRTFEQKQRDWYHEEIAFGAQYSVYKTKEDVVLKYPIENQKQTQSCVGHATALCLGIDNELEGNGFVRLSPAFIYRKRIQFPDEGMILSDAGNIAKNSGSCLFETLPTPTTEQEINRVQITTLAEEEASEYRSKNYLTIANYTDIDVLNSVASQGKAVRILIYASYNEWAQEYPRISTNVNLGNAAVRHSVTILPYSGFKDRIGVRYVTIQDSAHFGGFTHRYLSEDFIKARCYGSMYDINLKNEKISKKPKYEFKISMSYGQTNQEIMWLQKCLQYSGHFPSNTQPTGAYYGLTAKAVLDFQLEHKVADVTELMQLGGKVVGPKTLLALNKIFQ